MDFLGDLIGRFEMTAGEPSVREDFSVVWDGPDDRKIYLQNASVFQRGLADPNLSLNAWRSQVILNSISGGEQGVTRPEDSFLTWDPRALHDADLVLTGAVGA